MLDVTKKILFLKMCLHEEKRNIVSHPVTSKQPHKIVRRLMSYGLWVTLYARAPLSTVVKILLFRALEISKSY